MQGMDRNIVEQIVREAMKAEARTVVMEAVEALLRDNEARAKELSLMERVIRVEEELKSLREIESARFEAMEKRFEVLQREMTARFEAMEKRFEALQREMTARFEAVDKRFEALQREMTARFEAMEKRLAFMQWFMGIGFTVIVVLMSLINFLK